MKITSKHVIAFALFLLIACATPASAKCTFDNVSATRDNSGKGLTVSPTLVECDTVSAKLTLNAFNFSSVWNSTEVYYVSGPATIKIDKSTVKTGGLVLSAFIHDSGSLTFSKLGEYIFQARGRFGPSTPTPNFVLRITEFKVTPDRLNMATGGVAPNSNVFNVSTGLSSAIKFSTSLASNDGGDSMSKVSVDYQSSSKRGLVTASRQDSSGVFTVETKSSVFSANAVKVVVPPQPLIQIIIGEAEGTSDIAQKAVAVVIRNRLKHPWYRKKDTYSKVIFDREFGIQFRGTESAKFTQAANRTSKNAKSYDAALSVAAEIFARTDTLKVGGAIGFGSPNVYLTKSQFDVDKAKLLDAYNRCLKVSARGLLPKSKWFPDLSEDHQAVIINEIDPYIFVFIRPRPPGGCAVTKMDFQ
jgi:hypothetical protein